jgi:hypothetical protein
MPKHSPHILFLFTCLFTCLTSTAAPGKPFAKADSVVRSMPAEAAKSVQGLAAYIAQQVPGETERIKVIYVWIAYHIAYDVNELFAATPLSGNVDWAQLALNKRKGVCSGYAALFQALAQGVGIKCFEVSGMNIMPNGEYANVGHAWNVARIDGEWRLFDPTWAAGHMEGMKFVKRFSAKWFMPKPEDFIKTHLPFDPIWQLQAFPLTGNQFFKPKELPTDSTNRFLVHDSIAAYDRQTELERVLATAKRMRREAETGGVDNIPEGYASLRYWYYEINLMRRIYKAATNAYNEGVGKLNAYTLFYNKQYHPAKTQPDIQAMLDGPERDFTCTGLLLQKIVSKDKDITDDVKHLQTELNGVQKFIQQQNAFLKLYFATEPKKRDRLFSVRKS